MADMRLLIRRLGAAGCTVLLSSHLMTEVQELCDRVGVIAGGRLVAESTVAELRGTRTLRVVADPLDTAAAIVGSRWGTDAVRIADGVLDLAVDPGQAAAVNAELVAAGVAVSELTTRERSLEQAFFDLTRKEDSHV
jgi:ABC-2 type transport system ATP-binding protein